MSSLRSQLKERPIVISSTPIGRAVDELRWIAPGLRADSHLSHGENAEWSQYRRHRPWAQLEDQPARAGAEAGNQTVDVFVARLCGTVDAACLEFP